METYKQTTQKDEMDIKLWRISLIMEMAFDKNARDLTIMVNVGMWWSLATVKLLQLLTIKTSLIKWTPLINNYNN